MPRTFSIITARGRIWSTSRIMTGNRFRSSSCAGAGGQALGYEEAGEARGFPKPDWAGFVTNRTICESLYLGNRVACQTGAGMRHGHKRQENATPGGAATSPEEPRIAICVDDEESDLEALRAEASADPEAFWARLAESELHWFKKWDKVLRWDPPHAEWFTGGKINISDNCLDRHLGTWRRNKAALIWEGEPGDTRTLTYQQLHTEVCRFANVLKSLGVRDLLI